MSKFSRKFRAMRSPIKRASKQKNLDISDFAFEIHITGEDGGIFYIQNQQGRLIVQPYNYYDHMACIETSWNVLSGVINGAVEFQQALKEGTVRVFSYNSDEDYQKVLDYFTIYENKQVDLEEKLAAKKTDMDSLIDPLFFGERIDIDVARVFPVVVMATMSSGKSTLINALIGDDILPYKNEACTAKIFSIFDDDTAMDNKLYLTKTDGTVTEIRENLSEVLKEANNSDEIEKILLSGNIKGIQNTERSLLLIDTPGPNNSRNEKHAQIAEGVLKQIQGGLILYLLNATQFATHDDRDCLLFISGQLKEKSDLKLLFVMNKVDELDQERESILHYMIEARQYLIDCGIKEPHIVPISALAAGLFKKVEERETLTRKERMDFRRVYEIFKSEELRLGTYSVASDLSELSMKMEVDGKKFTFMQLENAIDNTGLPCLERMIQHYQILSSAKDPLKLGIKQEEEMEVQEEYIEDRRQDERPIFNIYVISTISSGKSTLINSLLRTELLPAENRACTGTIARILNNENMERKGYKAICYGSDGNIVRDEQVVTSADLKAYYELDDVTYIDIKGNIPGISNEKVRVHLYEIPGPSNCRDEHHGEEIRDIIRDKNAMVLYVMNVANFAVNDDKELLEVISTEMKKTGKEFRDRFIFVLNKCDVFDEAKGETALKAMSVAWEYLKSVFGIIDPVIIPASARNALLIWKARNGAPLMRKEKFELRLLEDFIDNKDLHYERYATVVPDIRKRLNNKVKEYHRNKETRDLEMFIHSGVGVLEEVIAEYIEKTLV